MHCRYLRFSKLLLYFWLSTLTEEAKIQKELRLTGKKNNTSEKSLIRKKYLFGKATADCSTSAFKLNAHFSSLVLEVPSVPILGGSSFCTITIQNDP